MKSPSVRLYKNRARTNSFKHYSSQMFRFDSIHILAFGFDFILSFDFQSDSKHYEKKKKHMKDFIFEIASYDTHESTNN